MAWRFRAQIRAPTARAALCALCARALKLLEIPKEIIFRKTNRLSCSRSARAPAPIQADET
jgi:hypothetical protein